MLDAVDRRNRFRRLLLELIAPELSDSKLRRVDHVGSASLLGGYDNWARR